MWKKLALFLLFPLPALAQVPVAPLLLPEQYFANPSNGGAPCAGCQLFSYSAGTTSPYPTYTDSTGTSQNPNPVILNAAGMAQIWVAGTGYKFVLEDPLGAVLWSVDNVTGAFGVPGPPNTSLQVNCLGVFCGYSTLEYTPTTGLQVGPPISGNTFNLNNLGTITSPWTQDVTSPCTAAQSFFPGLACDSAYGQANYTFPLGVTAQSLNGFVVVKAGQSILQAVNLLPSGGGTVIVPNGTFPSGTTSSPITTSNVTIIGAGMPIPNSGQTAMLAGSGSIIQGTLLFSGASNITVANLGVDVGDVQNNCTTQDGLVIQPTNDAIASPMLYQISVYNVSSLGCDHTFSGAAQQHDIRIEHATGVFESNIYTYNGFYGNVVKAIDANLYGIWTTGAYSNGGIIKSDDTQGISRNVHVYGYTLKNSGCFNLSTYGGTLSDVTISGLKVLTPGGTCAKGLWGQIVTDPGTGNPGVINGVKVLDAVIDGATDDAISFGAGSTNVTINHSTVRNETGNGVIFADTSAASNNSVDDLRLNTVSLAGVVSFGQNDSAKSVFCTAVTGACIENSGSSAKLSAENINAGGGTLYTSVSSATLLSDQIPGGITAPTLAGTNSITAAAGNYLTLRPGSGSPSFGFALQNNAGSTNWIQIDTSGDVLAGISLAVAPLAVASLPSAGSNAGQIRYVNDSTAISAEGQTCVGSSSTKALAFSNGSNWKCF